MDRSTAASRKAFRERVRARLFAALTRVAGGAWPRNANLAEGPLGSAGDVEMTTTESATAEERGDFIHDVLTSDLASGKDKEIVTRCPPEPNGYLHIGHAKSIALNFGIAQEFAGRCHLRFDDTNPTREEQEYIDSIQADVKWLGYDWGTDLFYASDYFERLYEWAEGLIRAGLAYVDDQSQEEIRIRRGTLTEPGRNSPFRDRP